MMKFYYNWVRTSVLLGLLCFAGAFLLSAQQPGSMTASSLESHEGVTITARPWTNAALYKEKFPKKSPLAAGVLAIHVAIRNDSDDSMKVNLDRIRLNVMLSEDTPQSIASLSSEEAADAVLNPGAKDPTSSRKKLPFPIPTSAPKTGHDKHWIEMEKSLHDAGVQASVVAPHSTVQGLLYFDLQGQLDLLSSAHLYVPEVLALEKQRNLLYFEIDLSQPASR